MTIPTPVRRYPGLSDLQSGIDEDKFVLATDYDALVALLERIAENATKSADTILAQQVPSSLIAAQFMFIAKLARERPSTNASEVSSESVQPTAAQREADMIYFRQAHGDDSIGRTPDQQSPRHSNFCLSLANPVYACDCYLSRASDQQSEILAPLASIPCRCGEQECANKGDGLGARYYCVRAASQQSGAQHE